MKYLWIFVFWFNKSQNRLDTQFNSQKSKLMAWPKPLRYKSDHIIMEYVFYCVLKFWLWLQIRTTQPKKWNKSLLLPSHRKIKYSTPTLTCVVTKSQILMKCKIPCLRVQIQMFIWRHDVYLVQILLKCQISYYGVS